MLGLIRKYPGAAFLALCVHIVFFALLVVSFKFSETAEPITDAQTQVVQAVTVNEAQVQSELNKLKAEQHRKQQARARVRRKVEQATQREEQRLAKLKQQQMSARQRLAKFKQQQVAAQQRLARFKQQQLVAQQRQAKLKQQQAALEKQHAAEARQVAALAAQRKAEEAAQRKAAAVAKRKAEEAAKRKVAGEELQQKLAAEEAARQAQKKALRKRRQATLMEEYKSRIRADISQHWLLPPNVRKGLVCRVRVSLIPTGDVVDVQVIKSSGDAVFDRSVVNAVKRASPLPVPPPGSGIFDTFRRFDMNFHPKDKR